MPKTTNRTRKKKASLANFYAEALTEAERQQLEHAEKVEGFDDEIATLRVRLRTAIDGHAEDIPLMLRGIDLLVKAVSAKYRLSKKAEADLADSLANVIRGVGGALMPERFDDG